MVEYWRRAWQRAWKDTKTFFGLGNIWHVVGRGGALLALGILISLLFGADDLAERWAERALYALIATFCLFLIVFAFNLFRAPDRLDRDLRNELKVATDKLSQWGDKTEIADQFEVLRQEGEEIRQKKFGQKRDRRDAIVEWFQRVDRLADEILPRNEAHRLKTAPQSPNERTGLFDADENLKERLAKLRNLIGRFLDPPRPD